MWHCIQASDFKALSQQQSGQLSLLDLKTSLCNRILNTGAPQGCVFSPLLFTLLNCDCAAKFH